MKKLIFTLTLLILCNMGFSQNVIDSRLQEVLNQKGDEMIDINIIFKSQMDLTKLRTRANTVVDKEVRRGILVNELKLFSEKEQQEVLSILQTGTRSQSVTNIKTYWLSNAISCTANRDIIYLLAKHPDIQHIGYDEIICMIPEGNQQDDITRDEEVYPTDNIPMVNADKVWELGITGKGVIVAIIDSGVNYNHADLKDHLWDGGSEFPKHGYNFIDNNDDPMDDYGHGTHCAGTICGDGTSGIQTGIAPDATLMCLKALNSSGNGSASSINSAMEFAVEHNADILSLSLGFPNSNTSNKTWLRNTCVNILELGVVASVAVGNHGKNATPQMQVPNNILIPGMCPPPWLHPDQKANSGGLSCVVAVGAIDFAENIYDSGSKGPVTWTDTEFNDYPYNPAIGLIRPDICAPGVGIKSLDHDNNNSYNLKSGTSMATPCVAGVMALMLEKQRDLTPADICMTLETTAKKLTDTKSNLFGTGLVDAFQAVTSLSQGPFTASLKSINDKDSNNNGSLNPGEKVKVSIDVTNDSDKSYSNVRAVISSTNSSVTITDAEATISNIAANEEVSLIDEFELSVDKNIDYEKQLYLEINFYDESENSISSYGLMIDIKSSELEFASFVIRNDDNGNGVLESGETAELGIILNNIGNELAVKVNGALSSSSDIISIDKSNASFSSIGSKSSGVAFFNVKVAELNGSPLDIPFEIKANDLYDNEYVFNGNYISNCNYTFELTDHYQDGWDGATLLVKYSDGKPTDSLTIVKKGNETFTISIANNVEVTLEWISGKYDAECAFTIYTENGDVFYTSPTYLTSGSPIFSWINDCSCQNEYSTLCEAVKDLSAKQNNGGIELTWSAGSNVSEYEIYRGTNLLGTTEETNFFDGNASKDEIYSVRAVYEDCVGLFADTSASTDMIKENITINASVYPNPSQGNFTVSCDDMTYVTVYNIVGSKIMETKVNGDKYVISGLESGVYFIDIRSDEGNIVKRILKF